MSIRSAFHQLVRSRKADSVLNRGSKAKTEIQSLQTILYHLGFGEELNWETYGADGGYGAGTTNAVLTFAKKNNLQGNGETVTQETAEKILARFDILDDMKYIHSAIHSDAVEERFYYGSFNYEAIVALQTLLNELGLTDALQWEKYGPDGEYGNFTANAIEEFAQSEGITLTERRVTKELATRIIDKMHPFFGSQWNKEEPPASPETIRGNLTLKQKDERGKTRFYISDGTDEVRFTKFRKGIYYYGKQTIRDAVNQNKAALEGLGLTDSALHVVTGVSENEGNLDGINTWDNSFMTFGMFQWTIGTGNGPGELASLLAKIKSADADLFNKAYGQYGLDVDLPLTTPTTGYLTLDGKKIASTADKEKLRSLEWAFYFWKSGQSPFIQTIQIQHALSRIDTFYESENYQCHDYYIKQLITSEYGIGLILDNHVNRPAYIKPCLEAALNETQLTGPDNWGTKEESQLIEAYVKVRKTFGRYPMTDADKRAAVTKKYLDNGTISAERGSFKY